MNEMSFGRQLASILNPYNKRSLEKPFEEPSLEALMFLLGLLVTPLLVYTYLRFGNLPVAVADRPFPLEKTVAHSILNRRVDAELEQSPIIAMNSDLVAGAEVYRQECAFCHGLPGSTSPLGKTMFPSAPQLWVQHRAGVVGVSDDPVGETFWKIENGIRLSGMPAIGPG